MEQEHRHRPAAAVCERRRERRARRRCAARGEGAARREGEEAHRCSGRHRSSSGAPGQGAPRLGGPAQLSIGSSALAASLSLASTGLASLPSLTSLHLDDPQSRQTAVCSLLSRPALGISRPAHQHGSALPRTTLASPCTRLLLPDAHTPAQSSLARDCARARASPRSARPSRPLPLIHATHLAPAAAPLGQHATSTTAHRPTNAACRRMSSHTRC